MVEVLKCLSSVLSNVFPCSFVVSINRGFMLVNFGGSENFQVQCVFAGCASCHHPIVFDLGVTPYEGCSWQVYPTGSLEWTGGLATS